MLIPRLRSGAYLALTGRIRTLPTVRRTAPLSTKPDETDPAGAPGGDSNTVEGNLVRVQVPAPVPYFERDTVPGAGPACPAAAQPFPGLRRQVAAVPARHPREEPAGWPPNRGPLGPLRKRRRPAMLSSTPLLPFPPGLRRRIHVRLGPARYFRGGGDGLSASPPPRMHSTEPSARRVGVRFRPLLPDCGHPEEIP